MNIVQEFKISISLGFVLYSFVAVSAWVFSEEILKRKAYEFKIGGFRKVRFYNHLVGRAAAIVHILVSS